MYEIIWSFVLVTQSTLSAKHSNLSGLQLLIVILLKIVHALLGQRFNMLYSYNTCLILVFGDLNKLVESSKKIPTPTANIKYFGSWLQYIFAIFKYLSVLAWCLNSRIITNTEGFIKIWLFRRSKTIILPVNFNHDLSNIPSFQQFFLLELVYHPLKRCFNVIALLLLQSLFRGSFHFELFFND